MNINALGIDNKTIIIMILALIVLAVIIAVILVNNSRKNALKKEISDLNVRFNAIKTVPLAFKLNKAQAMAKRNDETKAAVDEYYQKYEDAEKHINAISELLNNADDAVHSRKYKEAKEALKIIGENIGDSEKEVKDIDLFLEQFSKKENEQREYSSGLKQAYREIKLAVNERANSLSIAMGGIEKKLEKCENLFSSSEEWMYANDFLKAQDDLDEIADNLRDLKHGLKDIPDLVKDVKGVIPVMLDEVGRQYALVKQRGLCLDHLDIEERIRNVVSTLNEDVRTLTDGATGDVRTHIESAKEELNVILEKLTEEKDAYQEARNTSDVVGEQITELSRLETYVRGAYDKDQERYGLENLSPILDNEKVQIEGFKYSYTGINADLSSNRKPATMLLHEIKELSKKIENDIGVMGAYKSAIDKNTNDEKRAINQLMKLQVVINEVEVKVREYHLPAIAGSYNEDLVKGREYIATIKNLLNEIPLNLDVLNSTLDEAIDFIYTFYNNVNNVVGMAIMVENAIVFGNKYRSTYPEIDRELSKAEFSYLNGEYTKALTIAITCMETLFPKSIDEKILENA